jgi:hypothetical protein
MNKYQTENPEDEKMERKKSKDNNDKINPSHSNFNNTKAVKTLQKELKIVHKTYSRELNNVYMDNEKLTDLVEKLENQLFRYQQKERGCKGIIARLVDEKKNIIEEKEKWMECSLKQNWLYEKIKNVGLQQSDDIFDCFQDINLPETTINQRERYIPTIETDNTDYSDDSDYSDDLDDPVNLVDLVNTNRMYTYPIPGRARANHPDSYRFVIDILGTNIITWHDGRYNTVETFDETTVVEMRSLSENWYENRFPTPIEIEAARVIQRNFRRHTRFLQPHSWH